MSPSLIDIGLNLAHDSFGSDRDQVVERALEKGVGRMILTGSTVEVSLQAASLCLARPSALFSTAGIHPHHASGFDATSIESLKELAGWKQTVALGECGLDYFRDFSPRPVQRECFAAQLELATTLELPVFLHQRDSHRDFLSILGSYRKKLAGVVVHCFTGGPSELEDYLQLDCHIGVTGWVCDERRGSQLRESVPLVPLDRLMLETDAPYLIPRDLGLAERRNEPCHLPHIARTVADLQGIPVGDLARSTTENACRFFGLPPLR